MPENFPLKVEDELFLKLKEINPIWWNNLKSQDDIYIDIRKDNYIDVYYNGGNIIRELRYRNGSFQWKIHYQYMPVSATDDYINCNYDEKQNEIIFDNEQLGFHDLGNFDDEILNIIKRKISFYYPNDSEKGIQAQFIRNDRNYIDSEFQYNDLEGIRFDLVRIDKDEKKIVFVEIKTITDPRLYNDEISKQLNKYFKFIANNVTSLLDYYKKLFQIKKNLEILPEGLKNLDISDFQISNKLLLLFGDCNQKWINDNSKMIDNKIKPYCLGSYYFGKPAYNADITINNRNRHVF